MSREQEAQALLAGATPGRWYVEEDELTWQLFAEQVSEWSEGTPADVLELFPHGIQGHPMQLIKAPKSGTPYAEYWPSAGDAALIAAAPGLIADLLSDNAALAAENAQLRAQAGAVAGLREAVAERDAAWQALVVAEREWCVIPGASSMTDEEFDAADDAAADKYEPVKRRHQAALKAVESQLAALAQASAEGGAGTEGVG